MSGNVAVVGGGMMGSGIAQLAALSGSEVRLCDVDAAALERARSTIDDSLARLVKRDRLDADSVDEVRRRLTFTTSIEEAVTEADVVIESVFERLDVKHAAFDEIARYAPVDALLGTNTSQLSITSVGTTLGTRADRLIGIHFFNPPVKMRLVELVCGLATSAETLEEARAFALGLGKEVVVCKKDSPGFLTSRVSAILRLECLRMLEEGLASAADIDKAVRLAFNHPMGPLELGDYNGLDTYLDAITGLQLAHGDRFAPTVGLRNMVAAGRLGRKTGMGFYRYQPDGSRVEEG